MGYSKETIGYYFYHSIKLNVFFLIYVVFLENKLFLLKWVLNGADDASSTLISLRKNKWHIVWNSRIRLLVWSKKQGYLFFWLKTPRKYHRNLGKPIHILKIHKTSIQYLKPKIFPKLDLFFFMCFQGKRSLNRNSFSSYTLIWAQRGSIVQKKIKDQSEIFLKIYYCNP